MLRMHGPEVYDQWVKHEIPFNDPKVKEVVEAVSEIWFGEGNVLQSREEIATTSFGDAGIPLLDGDCMLHRQGNFYAAFLQENEGEVGEDKDVFAFYLPPMEEGTNPVLSAGLYAVAFNDKPETIETMRFLASPEYVTARVEAQKGGFLSPNKKQDVAVYPNDLERTFAEILAAGDPSASTRPT
jgi:alpha-glucoside transport system substrate-binding protein